MPIFEYICKCSEVKEVLLSSYEEAEVELVMCDSCEGLMDFVEFSKTADPKFVGTGWHVTDYKD